MNDAHIQSRSVCQPKRENHNKLITIALAKFSFRYIKVSSDSGGNGHDVASLPQCIDGQCPVLELKAACDARADCDLFQTHGFMKSCPPGNTTTPTTPCRSRTPWVNVDSYYKIRHTPDSTHQGT